MEMADQQHVDSTQIEFVVERERRETIVCGVNTGIEHDGLSFILKDMAGTTDLITAAEAEECEEV